MLLIRHTYTPHNRVVGIKKSTHAKESKNGKNRKKRLYNWRYTTLLQHTHTHTVITHIRFSSTRQTKKKRLAKSEKKLSGRVSPFSAKCEYCSFSVYYIRIVQAANSKKSMRYIKMCPKNTDNTSYHSTIIKSVFSIFFVMTLWDCYSRKNDNAISIWWNHHHHYYYCYILWSGKLYMRIYITYIMYVDCRELSIYLYADNL